MGNCFVPLEERIIGLSWPLLSVVICRIAPYHYLEDVSASLPGVEVWVKTVVLQNSSPVPAI